MGKKDHEFNFSSVYSVSIGDSKIAFFPSKPEKTWKIQFIDLFTHLAELRF